MSISAESSNTTCSPDPETSASTKARAWAFWQRNPKPLVPPEIASSVKVGHEKYMKYRVAHKVEGYTNAAKKQRRWYLWTSVAAIVGSATVPVLITLNKDITSGIDLAFIATILSLIVTILVSIEKLYRFREHWRSFDSVAAALHYEQLLFQTRAGVYGEKAAEKGAEKQGAEQGAEQDAKKEQLFALFVKRFEGLILEEKNLRIAMETTDLPSSSAIPSGESRP